MPSLHRHFSESNVASIHPPRRLLLALGIPALAGCQMSKARYVAYLTEADSVMSVLQEHLDRDFGLLERERFDYDEANGVFVLSDSGVAKVLADVQFVGKVSRRDSTWTWAWDLPYYDSYTQAARQARRYGWLHGIRRLRTSRWHGDDTDGWEMTSLTAHIAGAEGGYRAPAADSSSYVFLLLRNVRLAPVGRRVDSYLKSPRSDQ
ncbi:MAG TPA: hypothetical protein VGQ17_16735 [Gemmatimonadales bacterium]|jgi:hypothetical protein|nr:hypothetical protein [Gemmatimonadales bacterium]